jgi:tetratricopeptide (TPR) repeat protein
MEYFRSIEKARFLIESGRNQEAIRILQEQLTFNPDDGHMHALLSVCYSNLESHKQALDEAQRALSIAADESFNHYVLCRAFFVNGQYELSEKAIRDAIAIDQEDDSYYYMLAASLFNRDKYKACLEAINQGLSRTPNNNELLTLRSKCYINTGDSEKASRAIKASLNKDPDSADALATKGWISLNNHNRKDAEREFISALTLDPRHERAKEGLVEIYKLKSKFFNFFIRNSFRRIYYEPSWFLILWVIICIKTIPLWIALLSMYLLIGWYLSVLFNSFLRLGSRSRFLLSKNQVLQSNLFIGINSLILILIMTGALTEIEWFWKLSLPVIAILFMAIGTVEMYSDSGRRNSIIWSILLLVLLTGTLQYELLLCIISTVAVICFYGAGWSIRFRSK